MLSHRTTARGVLLLTIAALGLAAVLASPAASTRKVPTIVFPMIGTFQLDDNYGDPRVNGSHAGIDTMTPRRTPVVAAEAGKVKWWTTSARAGCMLYLYGRSGTTYLYIHLNNDRTLKNDNQGACADVAFTVRDGASVTAGQQIAWSGDSGDADGNPHLHFEVHPNDGADVNPFPYLVQATRHLFPARLGARFTLGLRGSATTAGGGRLSLRVTSVRWWPGGRWTTIDPRVVELGVDRSTQVDSTLASYVRAASTRTLSGRAPEVAYTAFTAPATTTAAALRGAPGALVAARVSRPGGTLVTSQPDSGDPPPGSTWTPPWEQDGSTSTVPDPPTTP